MILLSVGPIACILVALLFPAAQSRNVHRHRHFHRHYARRSASRVVAAVPMTHSTTPTSIVADEEAVATDGKALAHDVKEIEQGLAHLPKDFSKFFNAVEGVERLLSSLLSLSASGEQLTDIVPIPTPSTAATRTTQGQVTSSLTCYDPGSVGGPMPCPTTTNSAITTSTRSVQTLPRSPPYGYSNQTAKGYGHVSTASPTTSTLPLRHATTSPSSGRSGAPTSAFYTFNPQATDNVAVYYGQTPSTRAGGLLALCEDVDVDIVILAFVYEFIGGGGYPSAEFGPACWASPYPQAPGLANCTRLAPEIAACQSIGKKVLVSLGGAIGNSSLGSVGQADAFANTLWNLFGAGTYRTELRPFGQEVVVDGFDIDNEDNNPAYYDAFAAALRQQFAKDPSKTYYLSAAPQCPMPDASIPTGLMYEADFIWVQFYNNPPCNLGTGGFQPSFVAWSQNLAAGSRGPGKPRLYVGAPGAPTGAGSGYVPGSNLSSIVGQVLALNLSNMGGIMLWDGTEGVANVDKSTGANYLQYAKSALQL